MPPFIASTGLRPGRTGGTVPDRRCADGGKVCLLGTYPPTACGLATFTSNLRLAVIGATGWDLRIVRVLEDAAPAPAPEVAAQWIGGDTPSLARALAVLGSCRAVLLQHEYGLFAGRDGEEVLLVADSLQVPLVSVLHTVLERPSAHQREVLEHLISRSDAVVVQSEAARRRLLAVHGLGAERVTVIPHGAAANFGPPEPVPPGVRRPLVLSWGLLGPGKGVEHGIAALALLSTHDRRPTYVVSGQTHPKVLAREGEHYRRQLHRQARRLGVAEQVRFDDGYRDWASLRSLVRSADAVLLPYDSREQVSSGVLAEALASGKPVVATRFSHAEELLSQGAGILVEHGDVKAMALALERVLYEPALAAAMSAAARRAAEPLLWPAVGHSYARLVERLAGARAIA